MRGARWLLLVALVVMVGAVAVTYRAQKRALKKQAIPKPAALPAEVGAVAEQWQYRREKDNQTLVEITAKDFRQAKDSAEINLTDVQLKLHHEKAGKYDLVKSAAATFSSSDERLYSDGDVEITLAIPDDEEPKPNLVAIHSSGVTFETTSGKAETVRPATFTFRNGYGKADGASYDPSTHELHMLSDVELHLNPPGPNAKPMKIEANTLYYHEATSEIWLKPWGRMTRDNTVVEGYESVVHLQDQAVRKIETNRAHGHDEYPDRKLQYAADGIWMDFNDDGVVEKIVGEGNAQLTSTSGTSQTSIAAPRVEMTFLEQDGQSVLSRVSTTGKTAVTEKPAPLPGRQPGETHVLRSESIELKMRPDGKEIETVLAPSPGTLEFQPNLPSQHHRTLAGRDMVIGYGAQNRLDSFRAKDVKTVTDPNEDERRNNRGVTHTASRELAARFEADSSQISSLEQTGDFTYEEGARHARASKATLDSKSNVMVLETAARISDDTGSTSAERIRMDQRTGDFTAEGRVNSLRLQEKGKNDSGMLSGDEPLQAQAGRMETTNRNRTIHYQGGVNLWQGANRIQANDVVVDREKGTLVADGGVVTNLWEQPKEDEKKPASAPILTVARAPHLVYTDQTRLAVYTGGVILNRQGTQVKSRELRAYLAEEGADSRLVKAVADGGVEISQAAPDRTRTGTAEHVEYFTENQKVVLQGGQPQFTDSLKGNTHGVELTYFANDDRLLVNGSAEQPVHSRIRRK
jgi:lipopolysaccharide export system protein LptA